jgi:tellurite resistance protein TehA-like permease
MTTMTADRAARGGLRTADGGGAGFRLLPGRTVAYAWLLAAVPIALLQLVHAGVHEHHELPPVLHWLRDTALAVPLAAVAVVVAALLVARLRPTEPGERASLSTMALWGVLAALLFAALSIPGNQMHGLLFGAEEEEGVSLLNDLTADALYALEAALLVIAPLALLAGVPWRGAWHPAAPGRASDPPPQPSATTHDGGDR